jgi:polar amino acid transport system substrate-binding protein
VYQDYPPFIVDAKSEEGLSYELTRRLTELSDGSYDFRVIVASRARVNKEVVEKGSGSLLWVSEFWFGDLDRTRYLWTDPLMDDAATVISPAEATVNYQSPETLVGLEGAIVRGYSLPALTPYFQDGRIRRRDLSNEVSLVKFIAAGRADFGVATVSVGKFMLRDQQVAERVHVADTVYSQFSRRMMFTPDLAEVHAFVASVLPDIMDDPGILAVTRDYGVSDLWR